MDEKKAIEIVIPDPKEVFNQDFLPIVLRKPETRKPLLVIEGGRGSGKSRAIAQRLILAVLKRKLRVALVRKVADTIRHSMYQEIRDIVTEWKLGDHFTFVESRLEIQVSNGSMFLCKGLDKAEKTKSLASVDVVWIEEATELTENDWDTFRFSVRGESSLGVKERILSFNRTAGNWTEKKFFNADESFIDREGVYHHHSTFRSNRFLAKDDVDEIEYLKDTDPELYRKVAEGKPIRLKGLIFPNHRVVDAFPDKCEQVFYGLDFGVSDPTVLAKVGFVGRFVYVDELYYERGKTNQDLLEVLPELIPNKYDDICADSEDPNRILEIHRAGWNIKPANKEQNSVREGIGFLRGFTVCITARSTNIRKDFENYSWKKDKNGVEITPETPMHAFSHGVDPVRYVAYTFVCNGPDITLKEMQTVHIESLESSMIEGY